MIITTILLSLLSGFLYRLGGLSKEQAKKQIPWCPSWLINTKTRDVGCSVLAIAWMAIYCPTAWYWYLLAFGAMWGALTTYWDITGRDNFYLHGFGIALAFVFLANGHWLGFGIRAVTLAVLMGAWCAIFKNDWVEECGRGAFIVLTLPLMLI